MSETLPELPSRPPRPEPTQRRGSRLSLFFAFMFCLFVISTLSLLTLNAFGVVVGVAAVLFGVIGFHYFVWGWWLGEIIRRESETEASNRSVEDEQQV